MTYGLAIAGLHLEGFSTHDSTKIELPRQGIVLVTGPNGSGKSSIPDAVAAAIWGETVRDSSLWREKAAGRVVIDGVGFSVIRERSASGVSRLRWAVGDDPPAEFESMSKAQAQLALVAGSFEQWRRTHVLCADDGAAFTRAPDSVRKALLEQMLGIEGFEDGVSSLTHDRRKVDARAAGALVRIDAAEKQMAYAERHADSTVPAAVDVPGAERAVADARGTLDVLLALAQGHTDAARASERAMQAARTANAQACVQVAERLRRPPPVDPICGACTQPIDDEIARTLRTDYQTELAELEAAAYLAGIAYRDAELESERGAESAMAAGRDVRAAEAALYAAESKLQAERERAKSAALRKGLSDSYFDAAEARDAAEAEATLAEAELAVLHTVEKVLGPSGIRSVLLADALEWLTTLSNEWLSRISAGRPLRVSIEPYAERQGGGVKNAVTLKVSGAGLKGTYKSCSRGEQRRIDIAVLLGISELSQRVLGVTPGTMFVDEILDAIDDAGAEAVCDALNEMARDRCVVVISHNESVRRALRPVLALRVDAGKVTTCR